MSDFFSFEYIDEQTALSSDLVGDRSGYRRNQSLNQGSTEFLREAMKRLVPSTFVYGESGIGNRAYELYGMLYSLGFSGNRSGHLVAALCVMHATYERRSDLVILPTDIEHKYADMKIRQMTYSKILNLYDRMCRELGITKLEASMEKVIERVFRNGCRIESEKRIFEYTQTAMKLYQTVKLSFPPQAPDPAGRRINYQSQTRPATIGVLCALLATRVHMCVDIRLVDMSKEMAINDRVVHSVLNRCLASQASEATVVSGGEFTSEEEGVVKSDKKVSSQKGKRRPFRFSIGGIEIPPPMNRGTFTNEERKKLFEQFMSRPRDEIFSIPTSPPLGQASQGYPTQKYVQGDGPVHAPLANQQYVPTKQKGKHGADPLGFLFEDFSDLLPDEKTADVEPPERLSSSSAVSDGVEYD